MRIVADTNVLLRVAKPDHAEHTVAMQALAALQDAGHRCVMLPQGGYEYYVVATRPKENNGLGLTPDDALQDLAELMVLFRLLRDERAVFQHWLDLIGGYRVRGKAAHDARIVAAMKRHAVAHLLTFNVADFTRYADITVLDPASVAAGTAPL